MSDPQELSRQATAFLKEHKPGRYWGERRKLHRKLKRQAVLKRDLDNLRADAAKVVHAPARPGFVYVIGCAGHPVKIGIAADVANRLASIQTGSPHRLRVYSEIEVDDARAVERECHRRLSDRRLNGEWFDLTPEEAVELVKRVIQNCFSG